MCSALQRTGSLVPSTYTDQQLTAAWNFGSWGSDTLLASAGSELVCTAPRIYIWLQKLKS